MWYVYIIESVEHPDHTYIGASQDLEQRIKDHNNGFSKHTSKYKPWVLKWHCVFQNKYKALDFEKYLKSHSGKAFTNKRLI